MSPFTYIDDIRHCWRTKEPQICVICGQHSAVYPFIVHHDEGYDKFCVCDVCLRSGRLAERNLRVNSGDVRSLFHQIGQIQPELGVDERTRLALERTAEYERHGYYPPMPAHLIPFSNDGGGDSYCFDTSQCAEGECPVVFWDHEGDENQVPEVVSTNFLDWLEHVSSSQ